MEKTTVEGLKEKLWAAYDAGTMPERIRLKYATYCDLMTDVDFTRGCVYDREVVTFDGLSFVFDKTLWPGEIKIEGRPRLHGE